MSDQPSSGRAHRELEPVPSLVISMFQSIERQVERIADRLDEGNAWMTKTDGHLREIDNRVATQNGGVVKALAEIAILQEWRRAHDEREQMAEATAAGRKAQRKDDYAKLNGVQAFLADWWPLIFGAILGGFGMFSLVWAKLT